MCFSSFFFFFVWGLFVAIMFGVDDWEVRFV